MSFQAMTWALRQRTGNPTAKVILLALANYADDEGACFPGHEKLADECECSPRTVMRQIDVLVEAGLISVQHRNNPNGGRTSNRYFLALDDKLSGDRLSPPPCQIVTAYKDEPINEPTRIKKQGRANAALTELRTVLDEDRAQAVIDHRKRIGKALTPHAARLLAKRLSEASDPNAAADEMICNGWQGFKVDWLEAKRKRSTSRKPRGEDTPQLALERKPRANSMPATGGKIRVSTVDDYRLFRRCEQIVGTEGLRDKTGTCWWFPPDVVERARQELGERAHG